MERVTVSIRTKIILLTLVAILVSIVAVGGISIGSIRRAGAQNASENLNLICENRRYMVDEYLNSIEQSVSMVARIATEDVDSEELVAGDAVGLSGLEEPPQRSRAEQAALNRYLESHIQRIETVFHSVASHTNGALTYYYRLNPALSDKPLGFWYSRKGSARFVSLPLTELERYDADNMERVGWYYTPLLRGRPGWLEPYYNANLDTLMVSYVAPIYKAGSFIGVIGVDFGYSTLVEQLQSIRIYETGFAALLDGAGNIVYHPDLEMGRNMAELDPAFAAAAAELNVSDYSQEPIRYGAPGEERMLVFRTLANGMKLAVVAPLNEINAGWQRLVRVIFTAGAALLVAFGALTLVILRRMTDPLRRLTAAARELSQGNYDITLDYAESDEVGVLTAAFQQLINHLRAYISDLNSQAYQDALTGVKNARAYAAYAKKLSDAVSMADRTGHPAFALVMLDCNDLKTVNDRYGHEKGDLYLRNACELICRVFDRSPVFRVGGDEFVAVLQGVDYDRREELLREFDRMSADINGAASQPWERVSVAKGMAEYEPGADDSAECVARRADRRMYLDKREMKTVKKG